MNRDLSKDGIRRDFAHLGVQSLDVPPGWLHIVADCLAEVDRHTPDAERGTVVCGDIKEKHNGLSIHVHAGDWSDLIVDLFEGMADYTCAGCAAPIEAGAIYCADCTQAKGT